ncbi:MAG: phosphoglycerol transferase [Paraglaciecola psychrophila]|jgi:phosphoglycerol transferase
MLNAIHCTDYLVGNWIAELKRTDLLVNTVLVLFSDHLAMRNTQWDVLMANKKQRKLSFIVLTEEYPRVFGQPATPFNVAPTVQDYLGISGYGTLNAGVSCAMERPGHGFRLDQK